MSQLKTPAPGASVPAEAPARAVRTQAGALDPKRSLQEMVLALEMFWASRGCVLSNRILRGRAGTFTPRPSCARSDPSRGGSVTSTLASSKDGRYGENPNRFQRSTSIKCC